MYCDGRPDMGAFRTVVSIWKEFRVPWDTPTAHLPRSGCPVISRVSATVRSMAPSGDVERC